MTKRYTTMWTRWLVMSCLLFHLFTFSLLMTSCDEETAPDIDDILSSDDKEEVVGDALQITSIEFSDDYKVMELSARLMHEVGGQDLTDHPISISSAY